MAMRRSQPVLSANFPDLTSKARNLSLGIEGVSLFERHPPHFSTGVYTHSDHVAGHALIKELTGARVEVMVGDTQVIASGGKGQ